MCKKLIYVVSFITVLSGAITSIAKADLVSWWRFDEGSGNTINDSSGNGHHGTVLGTPEWGDGPDGFAGALNFKNTEGANCGIFDPTGGTGVFTLTLWCLWDGTSGTQHFLTMSNGWAADTMMFQVEVKGGNSDPSRTDRFALAYQGATQAILHEVPKNEWAHMALVFDGTNATGYLNGVDETGPQPTSIGDYVDAPVLIGVTWNGTRVFQGLLDDMRLYDRPLTESDILAVMEGSGGKYPLAYAPDPADGTLYIDNWVNLSWSPGDYAVSHDVYIGVNFDDVNDGTADTYRGNQTSTSLLVGFPGFPFPDGLVPGTTYYWRIDEVNETEPNSPWKGNVWSFSIPPKTAYNPDPADGAESIDLNVTLSWTGGYGSKLHTVYFGDNFDDVNNATGGSPQGLAAYTPGPLEMAKTYYWRVDEFDAVDTYKGEVWSFTTEGAVGSPNPANGAVDVKQTAVLSWVPGVYVASHQVYFGADEEAVSNADTGSPEYKGVRTLGNESYDPGKLEWDSTYYWRIDEVNNTNPDSPWKGPVWSFTTANFLVVDDFEDYDAGENQIWYAWKDGLGYGTPGTDPYYAGNGSGSAVGDENTPSYTEETIVHGGSQAMPLFYDNNKQGFLKYSEAERTLTNSRDWTENGVNRLTIWFRGDSANAAEPLYVAINGSAVVTNDNPDAAQATTWTEWNIDLQAFVDQGVNLANVDTIALGLGNKKNPLAGGSGTMYFDDIRLYPPAP